MSNTTRVLALGRIYGFFSRAVVEVVVPENGEMAVRLGVLDSHLSRGATLPQSSGCVLGRIGSTLIHVQSVILDR